MSLLVIKKPRGWIDREKFDKIYNAVTRLRGRRIGDYQWAVDEKTLARLDPFEVEEAINMLKEAGAIIEGDVEKALSVAGTAPQISVEFSGDMAIVETSSRELDEKIRKLMELDQDAGGFTIYRRVYDPNARTYVTRARTYMWRIDDGLYRLPRGAVPRLLRGLGVQVPVAYAEVPPIEVPRDMRPRDYQIAAVESALRQIGQVGAATIQAATGAGKTEMAILAIPSLLKANITAKGVPDLKKAIVIVPTRDLANQWLERMERYGIKAGRAFAGDFDLSPDVIVVTSATAYKAVSENLGIRSEVEEGEEEEEEEEAERLTADQYRQLADIIRNAKALIFDEAHHLPARTVRAVARAAPFSLRLGLSATPWRNDKLDLVLYNSAGEVVEPRITSSYLIERGFLVPALIFRLHFDASHDRHNNYQAEKSAVLNDPKRMELLERALRTLPVPYLILTAEEKPGRALTEFLKKAGHNVEFIYGKLNDKKRQEILDALRRGKLEGVVATTLADEGLDVPNLMTLVLYAGGKSNTRVFQRIGRVVRPYPGKRFGVVVDIIDDGTKYMSEHAKERMKLYETEPKWKVIDARGPEEIEKALAEELQRATEQPPKPVETVQTAPVEQPQPPAEQPPQTAEKPQEAPSTEVPATAEVAPPAARREKIYSGRRRMVMSDPFKEALRLALDKEPEKEWTTLGGTLRAKLWRPVSGVAVEVLASNKGITRLEHGGRLPAGMGRKSKKKAQPAVVPPPPPPPPPTPAPPPPPTTTGTKKTTRRRKKAQSV